MKKKLITIVTLAALTAAFAFAALKPTPKSDIVDTAVSAKGFSTLVAAVKAAELVEALKGSGPFTVFAPTDEAFRKLERSKPGILAKLLKPENKQMLVKILTYHVVPGSVKASDVMKLKDGTAVKTLSGNSIKVRNKHGVRVNDAKVLKTDILCTNGVIHVIDTVLLPK